MSSSYVYKSDTGYVYQQTNSNMIRPYHGLYALVALIAICIRRCCKKSRTDDSAIGEKCV